MSTRNTHCQICGTALVGAVDQSCPKCEPQLKKAGIKPLEGATYGRCRGLKCGRKVIWVEGLSFPLDPRRVRMYRKAEGELFWREGELGYISHFKTCPDAGRFSGGG